MSQSLVRDLFGSQLRIRGSVTLSVLPDGRMHMAVRTVVGFLVFILLNPIP